MPTYDYRCEKCGNEFEEFLPMVKRIEPTEEPCEKDVGVDEQAVCGGKISQVPGLTPPAFTYDKTLSNSLSPRNAKNLPDWIKDKKVIQKIEVKGV